MGQFYYYYYHNSLGTPNWLEMNSAIDITEDIENDEYLEVSYNSQNIDGVENTSNSSGDEKITEVARKPVFIRVKTYDPILIKSLAASLLKIHGMEEEIKQDQSKLESTASS